MIKERIPAGKQGINKKNNVLYNKTVDKLYKGSLGKVEIITGQYTKYVIEYCNHTFEFKYSELLDATFFNKKCLVVGIPIIEDWVHFINEAITNAVLIPDYKYAPNIAVAREYCAVLLRQNLIEKEGHYYVSRYDFVVQGIEDSSLLRRILVDHRVKVGEDKENWTLDPVKLQEFAGDSISPLL